MALDAILLSKIIVDIKPLIPCRITKIYQISKTEILFHLKTHQGKKQMIISTHSIYNRINLTDRVYPTPEEPSNFVMLLRKYFEGGTIISLTQKPLDRQLCFEVGFSNDIGDRTVWKMYVELMGKYANVIVVNQENRIVDALKRIAPFENNQRTIHPGATFKDIETQTNKLDPFVSNTYDHTIPLTKQFLGFSPLLEKEVRYRLDNGQSFTDIMKEISESNNLYIADDNSDDTFHTLALTHIKGYHKYGIHEGLDVAYYHKEEKDRIKQITGDVFKFVKAQIKHYKQKLPKLLHSYDEALDCERWRVYGDLLYTNNIYDTKGQSSITLCDYDGTNVEIPLDPKLDGKQNANKCYIKYRKQKKAQIHLQEQIAITKQELDYFEGLSEQLTLANFDDAKEIKEELIKQGYLKKTKQRIRKPNKKDNTPKFSTINLENTRILFGKNNLQNDYLTFKLANKTDLWFHAKDYHGSHVIVQGETNEDIIRLAANIAAYYSSGRLSSSVPVDYCQIKNLKRIPQAKPGNVQLTTYKTIYIDPDKEIINQYIDAQ